jgi:hypothetical protein
MEDMTVWITEPQQIEELPRLTPLLIRYRGAREGRMVVTAQEAEGTIAMLEGSRCYVRDISVQ